MSQDGKIYNVLAAYVATLDSDNTYGTPAAIERVGDFNDEPNYAEPTIMSAGQQTDGRAIMTHRVLTLNDSSMSYAARDIITGRTSSSSSGANGSVITRDDEMAGSGSPYIGLIVVMHVMTNQRVVFGYAKALGKEPQFQAQQNEFVAHELNFMTFKPAGSSKHRREKGYVSVLDLPDFTDAAVWDTFFSGVHS